MQSFSRKINQQFGVSIIRFFCTTGIKKNHQKGDYRTEIFYVSLQFLQFISFSIK